jgi:hypothetical protein
MATENFFYGVTDDLTNLDSQFGIYMTGNLTKAHREFFEANSPSVSNGCERGLAGLLNQQILDTVGCKWHIAS